MGIVLLIDRCTKIHERGEDFIFFWFFQAKYVRSIYIQFYMFKVLGFNIAQAGILASLPYLARLFSGFIFGSIGDALTKSEVMSVTAIRKTFCLFCKWTIDIASDRKSGYLCKIISFSAHILPGLCLIGLAYVGHHPYWCVAVITTSLGFNGASTLTNLQNSQDLAPNFAGTLYGVINFIGTTTGFLTPMVVGHFSIKVSGHIDFNWKQKKFKK